MSNPGRVKGQIRFGKPGVMRGAQRKAPSVGPSRGERGEDWKGTRLGAGGLESI
jgi:hypothetical protein